MSMGFWYASMWASGLLGIGLCLYGLHWLCLRLEERGHLFYLHKKPGSTAACLTALQESIEPRTQHVLHIKEQKRRQGENEAPGQGHSEQDDP